MSEFTGTITTTCCTRPSTSARSEEHTSELQSHSDLHSFPTRRSSDLLPVIPVFLSYVLSFVYVGIYWNNHHHMLHAAEHVSGAGLWANLHLLFWLSLIPFVTAWMDENKLLSAPVALYGFVLLMAAVAYFIFARI